MLNADSSTLKSESDDQSRKKPPTTPSAVALSWIVWTTRRIVVIEESGNAFFSSVTKKPDSSARPASPTSASERKSSGTNESSAKYAIIAARCVPRSTKNFENAFLTRARPRIEEDPSAGGTRRRRSRGGPVGSRSSGRRPGARRPHGDLVPDRVRRRPRGRRLAARL